MFLKLDTDFYSKEYQISVVGEVTVFFTPKTQRNIW